MTKIDVKQLEVGQVVWVRGVVNDIETSDILDLEIEYKRETGVIDTFWISSRACGLVAEAPQQPKPPAPVRLFGRIIFDLENCVQIGAVWKHFRDEEWSFEVSILRGGARDDLHFRFSTEEEATDAREVIEKAVLKAKGIDDENFRRNTIPP